MGDTTLSFFSASDCSSTWLVRCVVAGDTEALIPPGSACPCDSVTRRAEWSLCIWTAPAPDIDEELPDVCRPISVPDALRWARSERCYAEWVVERSSSYAHTLLDLVREMANGDSTDPDVHRVLADPALDLVNGLRLAVKDIRVADLVRGALEACPIPDSASSESAWLDAMLPQPA